MTKCHLPSLRECLSSLFSDRVDLILWNAKYILREILKGLKYLHEDEGIIHGNLKRELLLGIFHEFGVKLPLTGPVQIVALESWAMYLDFRI